MSLSILTIGVIPTSSNQNQFVVTSVVEFQVSIGSIGSDPQMFRIFGHDIHQFLGESSQWLDVNLDSGFIRATGNRKRMPLQWIDGWEIDKHVLSDSVQFQSLSQAMFSESDVNHFLLFGRRQDRLHWESSPDHSETFVEDDDHQDSDGIRLAL